MQNQAHTESTLHSASLQSDSAASYRGSELAADLLTRLFCRLPFQLSLRLWDSRTFRVGAADAGTQESPFTLVFRNPQVVSSAVLGRDPLRFAEAYFRGDLDIEGDFFSGEGAIQ